MLKKVASNLFMAAIIATLGCLPLKGTAHPPISGIRAAGCIVVSKAKRTEVSNARDAPENIAAMPTSPAKRGLRNHKNGESRHNDNGGASPPLLKRRRLDSEAIRF
jgi:hypothetical protein